MKQRNHKGTGAANGQSKRPRLPVLLSGLSLCWAVGWYSADGDTALLTVTILSTMLAIGMPRSLPGTTRHVVWSAVLLLIIGMAANVHRVLPPEDAMDYLRMYQYDRMATIFLVPAIVALFVRPNRAGITLITASSVPLLILALLREHGSRGEYDWTALMVWTGLVLPLLASQAQRASRPRSPDLPRMTRAEGVLRIAMPMVALGLTLLLLTPTTYVTRGGLEWVAGKLLSNSRRSAHDNELSLRTPPGGFQAQVRPILDVKAPRPPGYLRDAVYRHFERGVWVRSPATQIMESRRITSTQQAASETTIFSVSGTFEADQERWETRVLAPYRIYGMPLAEHTSAIHLPDPVDLLLDEEGIITWKDSIPTRTFYSYVDNRIANGITPPIPHKPTAFTFYTEYLSIPEAWQTSVAEWTTEVEGLADAENLETAIASVIRHFHLHFEYSLDPPEDTQNRLRSFMETRSGHCTLFATMATFMLRQHGIPTRVVTGYVSDERHAFTRRWIARERDGHAWAEAWDDRAGVWRRVEATPPGGLPNAFPPPNRFRLLGESIASVWRTFGDFLRAGDPLSVIADRGARFFLWLQDLLITPWTLVLLLLALLLIGIRRQARKTDTGDELAQLRAKLIATMLEVERKSVPGSMRRRPHETWTHWHSRIAPQLPTDKAVHLLQLLESYQDLRYQSALDAEKAQDWLEHARLQGKRTSIIRP